MTCFEPLILAGYMFMALPHRTNGSNLNAAFMEMQTCERGVGIGMKAAQSGVYALEAQYGIRLVEKGEITVTIIPKAGLAYHDVRLLEEQSKGTFSLSAQALVGYKQYRAGLEWWHMSNAGLGDRNAGLDLITVTVGVKF